MKRQSQFSSMPVTPDNTFGLGIQVYKIESKLPRISSDNHNRRSLIKQLELPTHARKYDKPTKFNNSTYDRIQQRQNTLAKELISSNNNTKSILNHRSSTLHKTYSKPTRISSAKLAPLTTKKDKPTFPKPLNQPIPQPTKTQIIKIFPSFQTQQLCKLEFKLKQISYNKRESKKTLKKQLKLCRNQDQKQRLLCQMQLLDQTDPIQQIMKRQELIPYETVDLYDPFGLQQYLAKGKTEDDSEDEGQYELIYKPAAKFMSEEQEQHLLNQEKINFRKQSTPEKPINNQEQKEQ